MAIIKKLGSKVSLQCLESLAHQDHETCKTVDCPVETLNRKFIQQHNETIL